MSKNYSVFSKEYETLFEQNFLTFCKKVRKTHKPEYINKEYSLFFPSCGTDQKSEVDFIIYGQATNRWPIKFFVNDDINSKSLTSKAKKFSNTKYETEENPLDWLNNEWDSETRKDGYNPEPSFFWNVTYKLINKYYNDNINSRDWCKKMIWSNLMKIAPAEGKNPYGVYGKRRWIRGNFRLSSLLSFLKKSLKMYSQNLLS